MSYAQPYDGFVATQSAGGDIECPPEDVYTLVLQGFRDCKIGQSFDDKPPSPVCLFDFKVVATDQLSPQYEWHDFDLGKWLTLKPEYEEGAKYQAPNLYLMLKALNGGNPAPVPKLAADHPAVVAGNATAGVSFAIGEVVGPFIGKTLRWLVGPKASGWPDLKGEPLVAGAPATGRRRGSPGVEVTSVSTPEPEADDTTNPDEPGF